MAESEVAIESKIGKFPNAPKLTEEAKHRVCELYAQFSTPTQVQKILKEEYQVDVSTASLCIYPRQKKWKPLIDRLRQEWAAGLMDLPLAHKRGRMEELIALFKRVQRAETLSEFSKITQSLAILRDMRAEMDEAKSHFTTIFATQIHNYSDEELITRRRELLSRLDELRGTGNGKIIEVHPTTGGNDGGISVQGQTAGCHVAEHGAAGSPPDAAGNVTRSTPESHS